MSTKAPIKTIWDIPIEKPNLNPDMPLALPEATPDKWIPVDPIKMPVKEPVKV